jgi:hypothetical protein
MLLILREHATPEQVAEMLYGITAS